VDAVVLRGLARDRDERWPDVQSFVEALQATAPARSRTLLVPSLDLPRPAATGSASSGSRVLFVLLCVAVFVAFFVGALVVTQQVS
jgi:hypothetical protein